ncbi:MAG: hypothetical protein Q4E45_04185 [Eubacteriales bacterium]|nr:hypothetical protein [Eubacteriales bacterium]
MRLSEQNRKTETALTVLLLLVLLGYLALYAYADFKGFARLSTTDMYEDTLVARLMWEGGTLFPKRYLFGNQLYVIATPALSALFYGLTGSMNLAMALATTCMSLLLLLSLDWMLRPFTKRPLPRAAALLAAVGLFFGPGSIRREDGPQLFYVMCSFYACYTITNFVVMGDYARARLDSRPRLPALLAALALCFCTGLQSPRQTAVTVLPLLCLEGLRLLSRLRKKLPPLAPGTRMPLLRTLAYTAANLAGLCASRFLPARKHTIYTGASVFSGASAADKLRSVRLALSTVSGFDYVAKSDARWFFLLMFLFCLLLDLAAAWLLLLRRKEEEKDAACFWWLSLIAALGAVAAFFVTSVNLRPIYLFTLYFLPALSLVLIARRVRPGLFRGLAAVLLLLTAANLHFSYREDIAAVNYPGETANEAVCRYALDSGYEYVYGAHSSTAPNIAACSDGKLIAGCWDDEVIYKVSPHINIRDIYHFLDYDRGIYIFRDTELKAGLYEAEAAGAVLTFRGQFGPYYVYTSSMQLLYPISDNVDYNPRWQEEYQN